MAALARIAASGVAGGGPCRATLVRETALPILSLSLPVVTVNAENTFTGASVYAQALGLKSVNCFLFSIAFQSSLI